MPPAEPDRLEPWMRTPKSWRRGGGCCGGKLVTEPWDLEGSRGAGVVVPAQLCHACQTPRPPVLAQGLGDSGAPLHHLHNFKCTSNLVEHLLCAGRGVALFFTFSLNPFDCWVTSVSQVRRQTQRGKDFIRSHSYQWRTGL